MGAAGADSARDMRADVRRCARMRAPEPARCPMATAVSWGAATRRPRGPSMIRGRQQQ